MLESVELVKLDEQNLKDGQSRNGGWNKEQLRLLGVAWPPKKGWKQSVLGNVYPKEIIKRFLAARIDNK